MDGYKTPAPHCQSIHPTMLITKISVGYPNAYNVYVCVFGLLPLGRLPIDRYVPSCTHVYYNTSSVPLPLCAIHLCTEVLFQKYLSGRISI